MYYQLTKAEKKLARKVMDKGLDLEYLEGLKLAEEVSQDYKRKKLTIKECYMKLYRELQKIDKNIGRLHNDKGGSRWVEVMAGQLAQGYISLEDIEGFHDKTKKVIRLMARVDDDADLRED